jgi:peptidoglycan/xylan/chitin deacetylase (PgdA/CDA1 family)
MVTLLASPYGDRLVKKTFPDTFTAMQWGIPSPAPAALCRGFAATAGRRLALRVVATMLAAFCVPAMAAGTSPSLPIIVYHQIRDGASGPPDSLDVISLDRFEAQMRYLKREGYVTLSAEEVVAFVAGGKPAGNKIVAIHFDDGWKSARLALPVLDRNGFKATFWVIPGKGIGEPHMDWDEIQAIARNPRYGVYSHSMTHPWKTNDTMLDWMSGRTPGKGAEQVRWEVAESRRLLAEKLGKPVPYLAWPGGHHDQEMIRIAVESGYVALFTVLNGVTLPGTDPLSIRRTMVHGGCDESVFAQILSDGIYRDCGLSVARPAD